MMIRRIIAILMLVTAGLVNAATNNDETVSTVEGTASMGTSISDESIHNDRVRDLQQENEILKLDIENEILKQQLQDLTNPPAP